MLLQCRMCLQRCARARGCVLSGCLRTRPRRAARCAWNGVQVYSLLRFMPFNQPYHIIYETLMIHNRRVLEFLISMPFN